MALPRVGAWVGQFWGRTADEMRSVAVQVETAGYGVMWVSEAFGREAFTAAAILLAATRSLVVATGIANMWVRDPMAMANAGRTLGEAWPGRFVQGVGVSHAPLVDRRGHDYASPLALASDYLEAMAAAGFRAPEPDPEVPLLVGALGERMLRLSARAADGAHPYLVTPDHTRAARVTLGDVAVLAPEQAFVLTEDASAARAAARRHLATYLGLDNYVRSLGRQGFTDDDLADGGSDRLVDGLVAWGSADAIAARMGEHLDAGADHVALQPLAHPDVDDPVAQLLALAPAVVDPPHDPS